MLQERISKALFCHYTLLNQPQIRTFFGGGGEGGGSLWRSTQIQLDNSQAAMVEDPVNTSGGRRGAVVVVVLGGIVLVEQFGHPHSSEGVEEE